MVTKFTKSFQKQDWVGKWYLIAKKLGRNDINLFGRALYHPETQSFELVDRRDFSHSLMDGAGAMVTYLRELGDTEIDFPSSNRNTPPPLSRRLSILIESQKLMSRANAQWKQANRTREQPPIDEFTSLIFLKEEAEEIKKYIRSQNISMNAWLLTKLQQYASKWLREPDSTQGWLVPVNMRGGVKKADWSINHSSAVPIFLSANDDPLQIHTQLRERLKNQIHWGNWWAYNMSAFMSEKRMEKIYHRSSETKFWMGTLSDMGEWKSGADYQGLGENEVWFASSPGSSNYPISCVQFNFNGNHCITFRVHPYITADDRPDADLASSIELEIAKAVGLKTDHSRLVIR